MPEGGVRGGTSHPDGCGGWRCISSGGGSGCGGRGSGGSADIGSVNGSGIRCGGEGGSGVSGNGAKKPTPNSFGMWLPLGMAGGAPWQPLSLAYSSAKSRQHLKRKPQIGNDGVYIGNACVSAKLHSRWGIQPMCSQPWGRLCMCAVQAKSTM